MVTHSVKAASHAKRVLFIKDGEVFHQIYRGNHTRQQMYEKISNETILMVTHSVKAASHAKRVLFIKDGEVFHQIYRGNHTRQQMYEKISNALTVLAGGGATE